MGETESEPTTATEDARRPYEAPVLVDCGDVSALTQTAFVTSGTDSGYS